MRKGMRMLAIEHVRRNGEERETESRFRDRQGRDHYDNGRYAPMRNDTNIEIEGRFRDDRGRERFEDGRFAPMSTGDYGESRYFPGHPFPVFRDTDMRHEDDDMNRIGFDANRELHTNYPMDANYPPGRDSAVRPASRMLGGAMVMDAAQPLTRQAAEKWVSSMQGADGSKGQYWNMEQVKQLMSKHGFQGDPVEWYAAINMMKRDYSKVAAKLGVDREEFYVCMADAFLNDADAMPGKLTKYYHAVAKKM